eukprot:SAG31_NODE_1952_length_6830_cov_12.132487_2_plen_272_part_00
MYERVNREPAVGDGCLDEITTAFLSIWADAGCRMIEMTCEEHDSYAASSQFMAHTTGRLLAELEPQTTPIDTRGYKALLDLVQTTTNDSFELYCGLFYYNANSKEQLDKLERGLRHLRSRLAEFESEQLAKDGGMAMRWMRDTSLSSTPVEKTTPQKWSSSQGLTKGEASLQTTTIHQSISPLARPPTEHVGFLSPATSLLERCAMLAHLLHFTFVIHFIQAMNPSSFAVSSSKRGPSSLHCKVVGLWVRSSRAMLFCSLCRRLGSWKLIY